MTAADVAEAVTIAHPAWCLHHINADECETTVDPGGFWDAAHTSRQLVVECGETFAWTMTARLSQVFECVPGHGITQSETAVELTTFSHESIVEPHTAYLRREDALRLIDVLQQLVRDMQHDG